MTVRIEQLKPHIGAVIHANKGDLLDKSFAEQCLGLLDDRVVLVFPELGLTDEEQLAFTDMLGARVNFIKSEQSGTDPDIYQVTMDPEVNKNPEYVLGTFFWHMDGVTVDIPPPKASLLSARCISDRGGDTEFANCFAAFEQLPDDEKAELDNLHVLHSIYASMRPMLEFDIRPQDWTGYNGSRVHPLVWTHSSGRRSLLIGSHADRIVELPLPEGRALLARLVEWTARPEFTYRHSWSVGDFVIWNNCGGIHRVVPYGRDSGRKMHRTSLAGTEMIA